MTYCVTRCRAENEVTFRGWVTRMLMSRVLSIGSSMFGRWVIMATVRWLIASPLQVYPTAETQTMPRVRSQELASCGRLTASRAACPMRDDERSVSRCAARRQETADTVRDGPGERE